MTTPTEQSIRDECENALALCAAALKGSTNG